MARITAEEAGGSNVIAFLDMIAHSEIGPAMLAATDDGYNVLVGSRPGKLLLFDSYADHPNVDNRALNSDAAGRYQIMHRWWPHYKRLLGLPDFGPRSQDLYAVRQLLEQKAMPHILAGNFAVAVNRCRNIWASLPGAGYGQHENKLAALQAAYQQAGGTLAAA